ncbi:YicC family protein [Corallincola luteus]|uniref:YicC family protein n=4 Tax=Psychromonadaceae TaxID=267894 RepID=A0A368NLY6_9GAMM|nr:YicC family protein [Corallincola holothuriorum]TAA46105.1 YicC family protein [Corallincola spongiicola]TCI04150.1 YicC family protein [Corallincola luteus]
MTAYARHTLKGEWGTAVWEVRSVNQRYLESYLRLPEQFRGLEPVLRERFRKRLNRGKLECNLRFDASAEKQSKLQINEALAKEVMRCAGWVNDQTSGSMHLNPLDVLRWPGVMENEEADIDTISTELLAAFDETLNQFIAARASEGDSLETMISQRLDGVMVEVAKVREQMPAVMIWQRERLTNKLEDANVELDNGRLEQEMILLAQRLDVAEELDRLEAHVAETRKILKKGGAIGRRLDFMMQEFNRESNTLASKSINQEVTQSAVELKVLIEQMREQIQNIE